MISSPMLNLAACGLAPNRWPSVSRTANFYRQALQAIAQLHYVEQGKLPIQVDLLLNFAGSGGWALAQQQRDFPCLFAMHGGCILDRDFLLSNLPLLSTNDVLIVNCRSDLAIMQAMFDGPGPSLALLPLPVDTTLFTPGSVAQRKNARSQLQLRDQDFCIGIVARLLPQKNIHGALDVVRELLARHPQQSVRIVIIGNFWTDYAILPFTTAPYSAQLAQLITQYGLQNLVSYLPADLSDVELATAYRAMDVLLHPTNSIDENFGYSPVEAMASGVPVVGCAYGGLKDTVLDGETGFLAPTWLSLGGLREDRSVLMHGLECLMLEAKTAQRLGQQARAHIEQGYTLAQRTQTLQEIAQQSVANWRNEAQRPLRLHAPRDMAAYDQHLHPLKGRMSDYAESILHYVSMAAPALGTELRPEMLVQCYSDYIAQSDGSITLSNPAWPANYHLSPLLQQILQQCSEPISVAQLLAQTRCDGDALAELLQLGLLIPCRYARAKT